MAEVVGLVSLDLLTGAHRSQDRRVRSVRPDTGRWAATPDEQAGESTICAAAVAAGNNSGGLSRRW